VGESEDLPAFYEILKKNLKLRHNVQPAHSLEELLQLRQMFPERIRLFAAHAENEMIAGIITFACNRRAALAFYVSHREAFQRYRGVNLVFYEAIRWCATQGWHFLDFGIFTVNMQPNWGLGRFKESFGAQGIFRDTMWMEF
jgi:lipid II:glycine glycyltransferase (peptidoglycan interpeptide bridge formation enzyme)